MKPPPDRARETRKAASVAKARAIVKAHLGWRVGHPRREPDGVLTWVRLDGEVVAVDGALLARGTRALAELEREHRAVLDDVVPGGADGVAAIRALLEAIKPAVHRAEALPDPIAAGLVHDRSARRAAALRRARPELASLVTAFAWLDAGDRARFARTLTTLEAWSPSLLPRANDDVAIALTIAARDGGGFDAVLPLARLLLDPRAESLLTAEHQLVAQAMAHPAATLPTLSPRPRSWRAELERLARALTTMTVRERARALALVAAFDLEKVFSEWEAFWQKIEKTLRTLASPTSELPKAAHAGVLGKLRQAGPPPVRPRETIDAVLFHATRTPESTARAIAKVIAEIGPDARTIPLAHHLRTLVQSDARRAELVIVELGRYLHETASLGEARLAPFRTTWLARSPSPSSYSVESDLLDEQPKTIRAFFEALTVTVRERARAKAEVREDATVWLVELVIAGVTPAVAARLAVAPLLPRGRYSTSLVANASAIADDDPERFAQVIDAARKVGAWEAAKASALLTPLVARGEAELAFDVVVSGSLPALMEAASVTEALGPRDPLTTFRGGSERAPFIEEYPAVFHDALRKLARAVPDAERVARRVLRDHARETRAIDEELGALRRVLAGAAPSPRTTRLEARLANLVRRRRDGARFPAKKIALLEKKLARAATQAVVAHVTEAARASSARFVQELLGVDAIPREWTTPLRQRLLAPIATLEPPMRAIAGRVLRARLGPPPWDLRDAPENRAFVERLTARGIRMDPWLAPAPPAERFTGTDGASFWMRLEDDPLVVMEMGLHFDTCLAPDGCNYFSVFTNAADINKRVLYARDGEGRVVARVLLALTGAGGIVTFNPYAHAATVGWAKQVGLFATRLAESMRTIVLPRGEVPKLVSPDWYDDGPRDLTDRFTFLADGSDFRNALATIDPDALVADVGARIAPLKLNELVLPLLLALPELQTNAPVVARLVSLVTKLPLVPPQSLVRAAALALGTDQARLLDDGLVERIERWARSLHAAHTYLDVASLEVLSRAAPRRALSLLRATRPANVRSLEDDTDPTRLWFAGQALEALHRHAQAVGCYRRGERGRGNALLVKACRDRLRALGA